MRSRQTAVIDAAMIPQPGSQLPKMVGDIAAVGDIPAYSPVDHVHKGNVNARQLSVPTSGVFTWVFPEAYPAGVEPLVTALVKQPAGVAVNMQPYVVNQYGDATNTQVQFIVFKAAPVTLGGSLTALLGALVNIFTPVPDNSVIRVNVFARMPPPIVP